MGYHYIPQLYLRGFEADEKIWAHDTTANRSFPTQVKVIANENKIWSQETERYLNENIEVPANSAITKIRDRKALSQEDKVALANYIITMWKRVPEARERVKNWVPDVATVIHEEITSELDAIALEDANLIQEVQELKERVAGVIARNIEKPPSELWHSTFESGNSPELVDATLSLNWVFLYCERPVFLTSDNPVFFFASEGIGRPTSELTFPISSTISLWATREKIESGKYLAASKNAIKEINRRTAYNSTRFIYSEKNEPWILPFATKDDWRLTRLRLGK